MREQFNSILFQSGTANKQHSYQSIDQSRQKGVNKLTFVSYNKVNLRKTNGNLKTKFKIQWRDTEGK